MILLTGIIDEVHFLPTNNILRYFIPTKKSQCFKVSACYKHNKSYKSDNFPANSLAVNCRRKCSVHYNSANKTLIDKV